LILALQFVLVLAVKVDCWVYGFCFHIGIIIYILSVSRMGFATGQRGNGVAG